MGIKHLGRMLLETVSEWAADRAPRMGAALAYYSVFSIAPLLLLVIGIAGEIFGPGPARRAILGQVEQTVGEPTASAIVTILDHMSGLGHRPLTAALGAAALLFGASAVFNELQASLNTIWKVTPRPGLGLWTVVRDRLLSVVVVLGTGFLLLVSLVISAALVSIEHYMTPAASAMPGGPWLWLGVNRGVSFAFVALLFGLIFKLLPDARVHWGDVWPAAVATALLFTAGKYLIGLYLGHSTLTSAYGAAGSVVVILVWVYYSAQILLLGAEFSRVWARARGSFVPPTEHAEPVTVAARARQGMLPPDNCTVPRPVE